MAGLDYIDLDPVENPRAQTLPEFLIVGAMKAGTSSLSFYLSRHPELFVPRPELHFFSREENWKKGIDWYAHEFRKYAGEKCVGEKSTSYSYGERSCVRGEIPRRIHSLFPDIKLIWCLRNPVDRAYSHYWHTAGNGGEHRSFDEAVLGARSTVSDRSSYVDRGVYLPQIARYLELFPREQMLFVISEDLYENTAATLRKIYTFLGVDPGFHGDHIYQVKSSRKHLPRMFWLQGRIYKFLAKWDRRLAKRFYKRSLGIASFERPPMRVDTRRKLEAYYAPHNRELSEFLGVDLEPRWRPRTPAGPQE